MGTYNNKIYWLASYPKSGNTWVRMFLNAYTNKSFKLNSDYQYVWHDFQPGMMQLICPIAIDNLSIEEQYLYHAATIYNTSLTYPAKCFKTHNAKIAVNYMPAIPLTISQAAIYIVRDPRDVCVSVANHFGYSIDASIEFMNNIKQGIEFRDTKLTHILLTWSEHVKSWTENNKSLDCLVIRYEDLLTKTDYAFSEILKVLNIPIEQKKLKRAIFDTSFKKLQKLEKEEGFNEAVDGVQFFKTGVAGNWENVLNKDQAAKIENDHKEVMEFYGYL